MAGRRKYVIGVTAGDPAGIGPEVTALALARASIRRRAEFLVIGDQSVFRRYAAFRDTPGLRLLDQGQIKAGAVRPGRPTADTGRASLAYLNTAVTMLKAGLLDALVTAPVCKEAIAGLGVPFVGHTEFLAQAFDVRRFEMLFAAQAMRTIILTRHIPLQDVSRAVTAEKILNALSLADDALRRQFAIKKPRIAVCGLNPHAGEGGLIGEEEKTTLIPALKRARAKGIRVEGPFAADTLFCAGHAGYDLILAMYHDQGLIPIKTLYFRQVVNVTIGLPFVRTSPAHGTAFDIAGKGKADPSSMMEALKLAADLAGR